MYGMLKAGIIAHKSLEEHLKPYGYAPERITQVLWTHKDRGINSILMVDHF